MVGIVGVGRTVNVFDIGIVFALRVLVLDYETDAGAGGDACKNPREDFDYIRLLALGGVLGLAGPPAIEIALQIGFAQFESRRTTVHYSAQSNAVAFSKSGYREELSKGITSHEASKALSYISLSRSMGTAYGRFK